jgi:hypothetical protein
MHTIKLEVPDSIYSHLMFFLQSLRTKDLKIVEDAMNVESVNHHPYSQIHAFSNHSANLVDEWLDSDEDGVWK